MTDIRGRFVWYEALTKDVAAAIRFYTAVFGWGTQRWDGGGQPYHMFENGGRAFAGLQPMPADAEAPPHWLGYIGTPDTVATTARAEHLGAKVWMRNLEIPTVGTMSVMQDPQGAFFAAYTPANPVRIATPQVGDVSWHEIATTDIDACFRFYSELFGWEKLAVHDMGPMGSYQLYGVGGDALGGIYVKPADMPVPPHVLYYVRVADIDAVIARVKEHGGQVLHGPVDVPDGDQVAICVDPQGAGFALHRIHDERPVSELR